METSIGSSLNCPTLNQEKNGFWQDIFFTLSITKPPGTFMVKLGEGLLTTRLPCLVFTIYSFFTSTANTSCQAPSDP